MPADGEEDWADAGAEGSSEDSEVPVRSRGITLGRPGSWPAAQLICLWKGDFGLEVESAASGTPSPLSTLGTPLTCRPRRRLRCTTAISKRSVARRALSRRRICCRLRDRQASKSSRVMPSGLPIICFQACPQNKGLKSNLVRFKKKFKERFSRFTGCQDCHCPKAKQP